MHLASHNPCMSGQYLLKLHRMLPAPLRAFLQRPECLLFDLFKQHVPHWNTAVPSSAASWRRLQRQSPSWMRPHRLLSRRPLRTRSRWGAASASAATGCAICFALLILHTPLSLWGPITVTQCLSSACGGHSRSAAVQSLLQTTKDVIILIRVF